MNSRTLIKTTFSLASLRKCASAIKVQRAVFSTSPSHHQESALLRTNNSRSPIEMEVLQGNSKAANSYIERVRAREKFMVEKMAEFAIGRRHLANMMGEDPDTFTQDDINRAIEYLFPSGLYEPLARPRVLPPDQVFPTKKEAQYDSTGRPYHCLFYTGKPFYYQAMHTLTKHMQELNKFEDQKIKEKASVEVIDRINLGGSVWFTKEKFEELLLERITDAQYAKFVLAMDRLSGHPYSRRVQDFIMQYRTPLSIKTSSTVIPPLLMREDGRPYMTAVGTRKRAKCIVQVIGEGSGKFNINGDTLLYFRAHHFREQVLMPLVVCDMLKKVDVVCRVEGGGESGHSGAIRYALSTALSSFVDQQTRENLRLAGLLTLDVRRRERKKPGQKGARAKFTWRKR